MHTLFYVATLQQLSSGCNAIIALQSPEKVSYKHGDFELTYLKNARKCDGELRPIKKKQIYFNM